MQGGGPYQERGEGPASGGKGKRPPKKVNRPGTGSTTTASPVEDEYVPTGGNSNDPNTWRDNPGYGQNFGEANKGAGYNPAFGSYEDFKAGRKDWRSRFQPGGYNYDKDQRIKASILGANPQSREQLGQLLNSLGIRDAKDQGQSYYRTMMGNYDNSIYGNYHIDPSTGRMINVGTSDVNAQWEPISGDAQNYLGTSFMDRLRGELGVGRFNSWQQKGKGSAEGMTANGLYYNHSADGRIGYMDRDGFYTDEHGKHIGGNYFLNDAGGVTGTGPNMPIGTGPGHLLGNNPAQNPGDLGYNAPPTGTNSVPASSVPQTPQPTGAWEGANPTSPLNTAPGGGVRAPGQNIKRGRGGSYTSSSPSPLSASITGSNPGGTSLPPGQSAASSANNGIPQNTSATPQLPGTVQTKTQNRLNPLSPAPVQQDPASNPNLLRLSMLGGQRPLVY